jgi:hypothetical protein
MITDDDDNHDIEMSWSDLIEERLVYISEEAQDKSKQHDNHSKCKKKLYYTTSTISIVIPFIITFINAVNDTQKYKQDFELMYIILVMLSGIVNALNTFFNHGKKESDHNIASIRYNELRTEIETVLILKRRYRTPADVTLKHFTNQIESLNKYSIGL